MYVFLNFLMVKVDKYLELFIEFVMSAYTIEILQRYYNCIIATISSTYRKIYT
jgi:hypothetical protein